MLAAYQVFFRGGALLREKTNLAQIFFPGRARRRRFRRHHINKRETMLKTGARYHEGSVVPCQMILKI